MESASSEAAATLRAQAVSRNAGTRAQQNARFSGTLTGLGGMAWRRIRERVEERKTEKSY